MFPTRQRILLLHLSGQVIRTTADHPFYVVGQGWTEASKLHVGDRLRNHHGQAVPIDGISESQEAVLKMQPGASPHLCTGLLPAGTLLETADGLKAIEDVKAGDYIAMPRPLDPERN